MSVYFQPKKLLILMYLCSCLAQLRFLQDHYDDQTNYLKHCTIFILYRNKEKSTTIVP